jgi:predicted anti-sigma-YlaC factor YlaD
VKQNALLALALGVTVLAAASCSINKLAINAVSDALTGNDSGAIFTGDSDPELIGQALPFAIKLYEALLAQNPRHEGLIVTSGSLFVMYANAFVQGPAERLDSILVDERYAALARAKRLYLRGAAILERGLALRFPGWEAAAREDAFLKDAEAGVWGVAAAEKLLSRASKQDAALLYWATAALLSAYSVDNLDFELGMRIPLCTDMIARAYELDPDFGGGTLDDFYVLFYASVPEGRGGNPEKAKTHFERALQKSGGRLAGPYVSWAKAVCVPRQDYADFRRNLEAALAVDLDADPANRLVNILAQQNARWLLENAAAFFLEIPEEYQ